MSILEKFEEFIQTHEYSEEALQELIILVKELDMLEHDQTEEEFMDNALELSRMLNRVKNATYVSEIVSMIVEFAENNPCSAESQTLLTKLVGEKVDSLPEDAFVELDGENFAEALYDEVELHKEELCAADEKHGHTDD